MNSFIHPFIHQGPKLNNVPEFSPAGLSNTRPASTEQEGTLDFASWLEQIESASLQPEEEVKATLFDLFMGVNIKELKEMMDPLMESDPEMLSEEFDTDILAILILPFIQNVTELKEYGSKQPQSLFPDREETIQRLSVFRERPAMMTMAWQGNTQGKPELALSSNEVVSSDDLLTQTIRDANRFGIDLHKRAESLGLQKEIDELNQKVDRFLTGESSAKDLKSLIQVLKRESVGIEYFPNETMEELDSVKGLEKLLQQTTLKNGSQTILTREALLDSDQPLQKPTESQPSFVVNRLFDPLKSTNTAQPAESSEPALRSDEQRFVKQLQRIFHQGTLTQLKDGQVQFTLKLFPEHLGKLQIQFIQTGQKLAAQIVAESAMTKDIVERSLPQLRQALNQQNIIIEQIDVEDTQQQGEQQQDKQESQQEHAQQNENEDQSNSLSFSFKSLLEGLFTNDAE
ncbi:flagellar hook-length control protein FliK [Alkalicoccobacillus porphyridii]|uniref:Flagellar hook-length control protein-like C-terminal domain-containing protein n=1 Tax=Alkalicoccobacillus porphyridii TaxID=2597270 RepID=A0A553ZY87_9BACI|nr:flagellar hook-length control protein FliK [Alkalicoccobacillus porphyridii]TSB46413.1 hypothetical protein FN960_11445 [Alkalicoccobacillus porphyridii]